MIIADILSELAEYWRSPEEGDRSIVPRLVKMGQPCLAILKNIAQDDSVDVNLRKAAIVCGAGFKDPAYATFLADTFVMGKNLSALYAAGGRGDEKADAAFCLFRQAQECLEEMGYEVRFRR